MAEPVHHDRAIAVTDPDDPRLAEYLGIRDAELRKATEERDGIFLAEGTSVVRRLLPSPYVIRSVVLTTSKYARLGDELDAALPPGVPIYVVERDVLAVVTGFNLHRGVIAAAERGAMAALDDIIATGGPIIALEGLTDHENLGAIARTARAFGATALVLDERCADPLYRRSVRVSMGEMLHLPWCRATLPELISRLQGAGWAIAALTPAPDAIDIATWTPNPARTVLLLGAEGPGLTAELLAAATPVRIPIAADVDSLNVGHAAAVALAMLCLRPSAAQAQVPGPDVEHDEGDRSGPNVDGSGPNAAGSIFA